MKQAWETVIAYKLVWVRVLFYIILPAALLFDSYTETWSQSDWEAQSSFAKIRLFVKMGIAGASGLVAFIDQSLNRAREAVETKRGRDEFLNKNTGP